LAFRRKGQVFASTSKNERNMVTIRLFMKIVFVMAEQKYSFIQ